MKLEDLFFCELDIDSINSAFADYIALNGLSSIELTKNGLTYEVVSDASEYALFLENIYYSETGAFYYAIYKIVKKYATYEEMIRCINLDINAPIQSSELAAEIDF